jgi:hypothetical protein
LPPNLTEWDETTGISPNTQYTRMVYAFGDCGESGPSAGQTRYALIEAPTAVTIGTVTPTSIAVSPAGTLSNLASGSSGVRISNTTAGTDSGWVQNQNPWTSSGLDANTAYSFVARARNGDAVETADCAPAVKWTLSAPPGAGSVTPSSSSRCVNASIEWTAADGFGAGGVEYYRYVWDQNPTYTWTGSEPQWSSGTISTVPTSVGTWYLHVQGYNGEDVANGTYDYPLAAGVTVGPDMDGDCDVDTDDFGLFRACFSGPFVLWVGDCQGKDFDDDGDVDLSDFGIFQRCMSGAGTPPDSGCAD